MVYSPRTDEILINGPTAGNQTGPVAARLTNGKLVTVWATPSNVTNDQWGIQAQFLDLVGNKIGPSFWITTPTVRLQSSPDVTALPNGGFALTWVANSLNGSNIFTAFYNSTGSKMTTDIFLDFGATSGVQAPEIAALADGSVAVVWVDNINLGDATISGAVVAPNGTVQNFSVVTNAGGIQYTPEVVGLSGGNFVVTWSDTSGVGGDADGSAVKAQIFGPTGAKIGGELLVNTSVAGSQEVPHVAALPSGGFVIVWDSPGGDRGQIFDASGNKVGAEFASPGAGPVTATANGGFVVSYEGADGSGSGIFAQQFAPDGSQVGSPFPVNAVTSGGQGAPEITTSANDEMFIVWQDASGVGGDDSGSGVKGRIFTTGAGTPGGDLFLVGTPGNDDYIGLDGNDTFHMQQGGDDDVHGGAGQDLAYFGAAFTAADSVDGGTGNDFLVLQGVYPNLVLTADSLANVENIIFWTFSNNGLGGATGSPNSFQITSVDATIAAGSVLTVDARQLANEEPVIFNGAAETDGRFFFYGGAGNDSFTGGAGDDSFDGGTGADTYTGGGGNDIYFVDNPADVVVEAIGGGGFDAVYSQVNYVLRAGSEVELLAINGVFSDQPMTLTGNELVQSIIGATGNDSLNGLGGSDYLTGNQGNDVLDGGTGADIMAGGVGHDVYFVDQAGDSIQEAAGGGSDAVYATGDYALQAGAEVELLATTGAAANLGITLYGNELVQSVIGADGNDNLFGGGGGDYMTGNAGNDVIDGGAGLDAMAGGAGNDVFRFVAASDAASDILYDFVSGSDLIDLSAIDANTALDGNQAFTFIGSNAFSNQAGQLRVEVSEGVAHILGDVNGDGVADLHILAYNLAAPLAASDFAL